MKTLQNSKCLIEYRENEKQIFARDLTDQNNNPAMYTKTKRGLKLAWQDICDHWNEKTTLHNVFCIIQNYKIKTHYWCMMD